MYSNIDAERSRLGWPRSRLADYLDTSDTSLKKWIRGTTELPASKLIRMAQLFGCSTDYLLGLDDTWKKPPQSGAEEETELHRLMRELLIALSKSQSPAK